MDLSEEAKSAPAARMNFTPCAHRRDQGEPQHAHEGGIAPLLAVEKGKIGAFTASRAVVHVPMYHPGTARVPGMMLTAEVETFQLLFAFSSGLYAVIHFVPDICLGLRFRKIILILIMPQRITINRK